MLMDRAARNAARRGALRNTGAEGDKGMESLEIGGGHPPKKIDSAPGVSLTRPESAFLDALSDPLSTAQSLRRLGAAAFLRVADVNYIREWVINHGAHFVVCEVANIDAAEGARIFRNPVVRKVINAAAERGMCLPTSSVKEELEDYWTQRMRSPWLPEMIRDNAADKLAKLKGFYPDAKTAAMGGSAIQINLVNPYADRAEREVEIDAAD